jgi:hypothetical protein
VNRQAVYDKVKAHLLAQNARAMDHEETCLYRGPYGLKCAIGCLISDEAYYSDLEMLTPSDTPVQRALAKSGVKIEDEEDELFLTRLQQVHDLWPVRDWASRLANLAANYGLNP